MPPMASIKNTIVLGCFILVGFVILAYLNAYWTRYEKGPFRPDDSYSLMVRMRFNKMTGHHENFDKDRKVWLDTIEEGLKKINP